MKSAYFGLLGLMSGSFSALEQPELVNDGTRFEPPIVLEFVGAGAGLAAPEVEDGAAARHGVAHQRPVHIVVGPGAPGLIQAAGVIGQHPVTEEIAQHAADARGPGDER